VIGDRAGLVSDLKALVAQLEDDIRARIGEVPELRAHLADEHRKAREAQRTAMSVEEWREGEITQAAVAWVLACVFVRFMEDNDLIDSPLISGAGDRRTAALGHREEHFREHPEHSDREYLESVFGLAASHPAVAPLYDRRHNPLWQLGPTADGARELREFWTRIDPDTGALAHDFSDPALGTRFLGDLYQDLSESAKKRYALLQTPEFVEEFILDRTLDPAIEEFGLDLVRMIDPTCGSGHFLIGAFERLFARWRDREPGTAAEVLAQRAFDRGTRSGPQPLRHRHCPVSSAGGRSARLRDRTSVGSSCLPPQPRDRRQPAPRRGAGAVRGFRSLPRGDPPRF
jgi:hypothetical protein